MAALAAVAGLTDFLGDERIRRLGDALKHMLANVTAVVLELVNLLLRLKNPGLHRFDRCLSSPASSC